jgi:hypothetical protein
MTDNTDLQKPFTDEQLKAWASLLHFSWHKGNDVMSAGPALAARVIELEAENARLRGYIEGMIPEMEKFNQHWFDVSEALTALKRGEAS